MIKKNSESYGSIFSVEQTNRIIMNDFKKNAEKNAIQRDSVSQISYISDRLLTIFTHSNSILEGADQTAACRLSIGIRFKSEWVSNPMHKPETIDKATRIGKYNCIKYC